MPTKLFDEITVRLPIVASNFTAWNEIDVGFL